MVSTDGYILTCRHVVWSDAGPASLIDVELQGDVHLRARLVGSEPTLDLAVLKAEGPLELRPATLGSADEPRVGQWVIALGDPEGAERTFVAGILSARPERECYQEQLSRTYLQTSLRIHPESYGGPLVDIDSRVIGLLVPRGDTAAVGLETASTYALPIDLAVTLFDTLKARESQRSPWLGIAVLHLDPELRRERGGAPRTGIYIEDVFRPSPASDADIRPGDVLTRIDGEPVLSVRGFQRELYLLGIGQTIEVEVDRAGATLRKTLTIENRPASAATR